MMQLGRIAEMVGGTLIGDPQLECSGANPPHDASGDEITMLDDPRRFESITETQALAVLTSARLEVGDLAQLIVADPHGAFSKLVAFFRPPVVSQMQTCGIDPTAQIADSAQIHPSATVGVDARVGERTQIGPGVVIMPKCEIGDDCVLHANVTLYEYTRIGHRVTIHASSVIGANGFGYRQDSGRHVPTAQLGYVSVESDVEIGAGATIDRGTYGATRIGEGTKIDNQVMIAHNCRIGRHNLICSQVGIAGSCCTGDYVILAGQVGLKDHITLGDHTIVGAQAGVMDDCQGGNVYLGSPATVQREQMQIMAVERRLPEMRREVKTLRRDVDRLQQIADQSDRGDQRAA